MALKIHATKTSPNRVLLVNRGGVETPFTQDRDVFKVMLPAVKYGYMLVFMIIPVGDAHPERSQYIQIMRNEETLKKLTVKQARRLPRTSDGAFEIHLN